MDIQTIENVINKILDQFEKLLDEVLWQVEDWWHTNSFALPTLWYNLQNFFDPMPPDDGSLGLNLVEFALTHLTTRQAYREAWYKYDQAKWSTNPRTARRVIPKLKNDDAIKSYYLLYKLQLLIVENYKTLLGELELRRVYSAKELKKAKRDRVLRAHHKLTFEKYIEKL